MLDSKRLSICQRVNGMGALLTIDNLAIGYWLLAIGL